MRIKKRTTKNIRTKFTDKDIENYEKDIFGFIDRVTFTIYLLFDGVCAVSVFL